LYEKLDFAAKAVMMRPDNVVGPEAQSTDHDDSLTTILKAIFCEINISRADWGRELNVLPSSLSQWATGRIAPRSDRLLRILDRLDREDSGHSRELLARFHRIARLPTSQSAPKIRGVATLNDYLAAGASEELVESLKLLPAVWSARLLREMRDVIQKYQKLADGPLDPAAVRPAMHTLQNDSVDYLIQERLVESGDQAMLVTRDVLSELDASPKRHGPLVEAIQKRNKAWKSSLLDPVLLLTARDLDTVVTFSIDDEKPNLGGSPAEVYGRMKKGMAKAFYSRLSKESAAS
jgi:transcriptional regulator with XRE-family HTH domain